jgi:hypothetical protein
MIGSMALTSGTKLGPYEIKDKLGAGGCRRQPKDTAWPTETNR